MFINEILIPKREDILNFIKDKCKYLDIDRVCFLKRDDNTMCVRSFTLSNCECENSLNSKKIDYTLYTASRQRDYMKIIKIKDGCVILKREFNGCIFDLDFETFINTFKDIMNLKDFIIFEANHCLKITDSTIMREQMWSCIGGWKNEKDLFNKTKQFFAELKRAIENEDKNKSKQRG